MMANPLSQRLATSATGYGAVIDGILDIRTVTETPNAAALNALFIKGIRVASNCTDRDCHCMVRTLAKMLPDVKIVAVSVQVTK